MKIKYTPEIIEIIRNNYPQYGSEYCLKLLGPSFKKENIRALCTREGIKRLPTFYVEKFVKIEDPKIAYFLGLIWADGSVHHGNTAITLEVVKDDGLLFYETIKHIGKFSICDRLRKGRTRIIMSIALCNTEVTNYLCGFGYREKSKIAPKLLLEHIPKNLHNYFWLGYFDGDGCIYQKDFTSQMSFAGSYDQDWSSLIKFLQENGCSPKINQTTNSFGHKSSSVRITTEFDILEICKIFYKDYEQTKIGLPRKYEKYLKVLEQSKKRRFNKTGFVGVSKRGKGKFSFGFSYKGVSYKEEGFNTAAEAALAYDKVAVKCLGRKAKTNFPIENYTSQFISNPDLQPAEIEKPLQDYPC